ARGYLNRPDLTAEKFVPNPFINEEALTLEKQSGSTPSLRLYRTGDLARYLPDGNIEFLGRIDDQVKIRGFRIELGEIESTLKSHGDVAQVVVIAREDEPGDKKLVAYIVPQENPLASLKPESTFSSSSEEPFSTLNGEVIPALTEDLRNHLARSLPDYMVPSFFIYIDRVPLTPNGKIDRKALPAPDLTLRQLGDEYVAPQSQLEQELCSIWKEVLKIEQIGIHDNFF
ncbi:MAG: AMP-binding protein, partial [Alphaproteobacteria bacterium]|nr:AMP-binding protein [Alphaproteobacteria bacterium]